MKRDMDLIREILLAVESVEDPYIIELEIDGYSDQQIAFHVELLAEHGLLVANIDHAVSGKTLFGIRRLTWDGYEFLSLASSPKVWKEAKQAFVERGAEVSFDVLKAALIAGAMKLMGLVP